MTRTLLNQCVSCGEVRPHKARHLCVECYTREHAAGTLSLWPPVTYTPTLVCTCQDSDADPRVDAGMCHKCGRKPLRLLQLPKDHPAYRPPLNLVSA